MTPCKQKHDSSNSNTLNNVPHQSSSSNLSRIHCRVAAAILFLQVSRLKASSSLAPTASRAFLTQSIHLSFGVPLLFPCGTISIALRPEYSSSLLAFHSWWNSFVTKDTRNYSPAVPSALDPSVYFCPNSTFFLQYTSKVFKFCCLQ